MYTPTASAANNGRSASSTLINERQLTLKAALEEAYFQAEYTGFDTKNAEFTPGLGVNF